MATSTMNSKGIITIPAVIREHMGVRAGSRLEYITQEDGNVLILPMAADVDNLKDAPPA